MSKFNAPLHCFKLCLSLASLLLSSCYQQFYATGTKEPPIARDLANVRDWNKEIILHFEDSIVHLQHMTLSNDTLVGQAALLPGELSKQLRPDRKHPNGYRTRKDPTAINQAHIYVRGWLSHYRQSTESIVYIPCSAVHRMDVYERDRTAIAFNYTMSTIGIVAGVLLTGMFVAMATGNFVPF